MDSRQKSVRYILTSTDVKLLLSPFITRSSKRPNHSAKTKMNVVKSSNNSNSLKDVQKEGKKENVSPSGSGISDSLPQDDNGSLGCTTDEEDFWASISANERSGKLLSNHRKGSLALNQILLDRRRENNQPEEYDEYADIDVKAIAAAISEEREGDDSEHDSDSSGSGYVSEGSDLDDDSSDEESEHEVFDFENHINKLVKRENKSESDNDSDSDGNESVNSEKVFKKAVEKAMKKIKRERSEEIVESDLESAKTSHKESEAEESPTSEDHSASKASDTEEENENAYRFRYLAPMLEENNVQDLRWPFSNLYVNELEQDPGMPLSDFDEALPSYRSTVATAFHPDRKRNVMLGRVWWVEWWAKDDSRVGKYPDKSYVL